MSELIDREALKDAVKRYAGEPIKEKDRKCQAICLDILGTIDSQPAASPWHRVGERLPPMLYQAEGDDFCIDYSLIVLAYREASHDFYLARQMDDGHGATWGTDCFDELYGVTHWMPLPEPPKEE